MANASNIKNASLGARFRKFFTDRDFIFHDGRDLRRFSIAGRTQAAIARDQLEAERSALATVR